MTKPTFRVGMKRPTNIYVALDPANPENDPQIGYIIEGWAEVLVNQANESPAWTKGRDHSVERLVTAARAASLWYGEHSDLEDITTEMRVCLDELYDAAKPFQIYDQDDAR